ncbi:Replication factor C subunit 3 [Hondaea fermentalgiana]|uniref:Replication factor C subunit 3 n=1 Tax=Hondaea fermentalgiana TaxID=2315210 RepID=A0A2R5GHQ2_9STRA|nr:Replication factor C subunit 3 [Hondaea fermentalgiana]|eukprot:GBG30426.1 Replication factor C subunit 3 [Hondaea fermentalgiana]
MALLREIYGPGVEKVKLEHRVFKTPTGRKIELTTLGSNYHIEMNPSDAGNNDRYVVQEVIKEIAQASLVVASGSRTAPNPFASSSSSSSAAATAAAGSETKGRGKANFKVVFLSDCDYLTKAAQHGLRRTMEKYVRNCRLILCCENLSKVIDPLRSRCLPIRVAAPSHEEMCAVLQTVAKRESVTLTPSACAAIASNSQRNLRRALLMAESQGVATDKGAQLQLPDWEVYVSDLAKRICKDQSPAGLLAARTMLYDLLGNCIPPTVIFQALVRALLPKLDAELKHKVVTCAAEYEHRLHHGQKDIYHLEAFVAKFMLLYREYIMQNFSF